MWSGTANLHQNSHFMCELTAFISWVTWPRHNVGHGPAYRQVKPLTSVNAHHCCATKSKQSNVNCANTFFFFWFRNVLFWMPSHSGYPQPCALCYWDKSPQPLTWICNWRVICVSQKKCTCWFPTEMSQACATQALGRLEGLHFPVSLGTFGGSWEFEYESL